jgi:acetylornithine deacetylase/succinyl-diaminopimelate desuccinylase-like protein
MNHEAVSLLSDYLKIDTSNPPGDVAAAADFLAGILAEAGIPTKLYEPKPGCVSLKAVLEGGNDKPPLLLLNHTDVVPANAAEWSFDPFGGEVREGFVHGRGALDMKGLGILELVAFLNLKRSGQRLCRDVVFMAVADEEVGGAHGAAYLLDTHPEDFEAGLVLNEGGLGVSGLLPDRPVHMISSAEKGPCWLKLTRTGQSGHGSMPHGQNALEQLVLALGRILPAENKVTVTPVVAEYFRRLGQEWTFLEPFLKDNRPETLVQIIEESGLLGMPEVAAMLKNTVSLNLLQAGVKTNVIPSLAEAHLDVRLLPGQDIDAFIDALRIRLADDKIQVVSMGAFPPNQSPMDHPDFELLADVLECHFPDAVVTPSLSTGTTDSRFFRQRGVPAYGFFPIVVPLADIKTIHGIDEKISLENVERGVGIYTEVVERLAGIG